MNKWRTKALLAALLVVMLAPSAQLHAASQLARPVPWEYKGFSMVVWWQDDLFNSGSALRQLAATGANSVTFTFMWFMPDPHSSTIRRTQQTATDGSLIWAINEAHSLGLSVLLNPHVEVESGEWRALIDPADPNAWFANYAALINYYADLARAQGVAGLCVGAELISMSTNRAYEAQWRALIAGARQRFGGALTYSANWGSGIYEEFGRVPFWDALDYLGISAYFPVSDTNSPTVAQMVQRWNEWRAIKIEPFQQQWNKPVVFTEVGYRSVDGAARQPWAYDLQGPLDLREQQDAWEALFRAWVDVPWFHGGAFWSWSTHADVTPQSTGYEVQNKPAYATIMAWFGGQRVFVPAVPRTP